MNKSELVEAIASNSGLSKADSKRALEGFITATEGALIIQQRTRHVTVALENIFQPHNASAVLRSCDCFGVQDVHVIENTNEYAPNREIDMGSSKWLNIQHYSETENNTLECINKLKAKGYKIVATTPHENDSFIDELPVDQPVALLFCCPRFVQYY